MAHMQGCMEWDLKKINKVLTVRWNAVECAVLLELMLIPKGRRKRREWVLLGVETNKVVI